MPTWNFVLQLIDSVGNDEVRFAVTRLDPRGPRIRGPDGGIDHAGYTEADLRRTLIESYKLSETVVDALIQNAKAINATTVRD